MKKSSDKTIFIIILLAGGVFLALKYWMYFLAAVILIGGAVAVLYFRNPTFRFWLLSKLHRKPKKPAREPEPPTATKRDAATTGTKPPPRAQRPKPNVRQTVIIEAPFDPKKLTDKQVIDEVITRGLGR